MKYEKKMKKSSCLLVMIFISALLISVHTKAQTEQDSIKKSYWTISFGPGINLTNAHGSEYTMSENLKMLSGLGAISGGYWFSPAYGITAQLKSGMLKSKRVYMIEGEKDRGTIHEYLRLPYIDLSVGLVTNVLNWGDEKMNGRPVSLLLHGGGGVLVSFPKGGRVMPAFNVGTSVSIKLTEEWYLEPRIQGNIVPARFNHIYRKKGLDGFAELLVSLSYQFQ